MRKPIYHRADACCRWKNRIPLAKGHVHGDDDGFCFITRLNQLEKYIRCLVIIGQVSKLIDDKQIGPRKVLDSKIHAAKRVLFIELVKDIGSGAKFDGFACE